MKKVLHILSSLERSGMEIMLLNSYAEWQRHGFHCDVLATARSIGPLASELQEAGYGTFHIPFRSQTPYVPALSFLRSFYLLCRSNYDVVHIHTEAAAPLFAIIAKLAGVQTIAVTHHNVFRFDGLLRFRKRVERFLIRMLGGRSAMISESVAQCEAQRFGNSGVMITNWLDTHHFRPPSVEERAQARKDLELPEDTFVVLSVGNCSLVKNHRAILEALALESETASMMYLHVGKEEVDHSERALAENLGVQHAVCFYGSTADPRAYHWAADAFLMPSIYEGLGVAALEAIASGVPSILADVDGLRDLPKVAKNAVLIPLGSQSLAQALQVLAGMDPFDRRERALADSTAVREHFSIENGVLSITEGLYCPA